MKSRCFVEYSSSSVAHVKMPLLSLSTDSSIVLINSVIHKKNTEKFLVFFPLPENLEKPYVNCLFFWIKNRRARIFLVQFHEASKFLDRKLVSVWKSDVNILYTFQFYVTKFLSPYKQCNRRCDDSLWLSYETRKISLKNLRSYRIALRYIQFVWLFILKNIQFISMTD